jgi:hypothetical protein
MTLSQRELSEIFYAAFFREAERLAIAYPSFSTKEIEAHAWKFASTYVYMRAKEHLKQDDSWKAGLE